MLQRRDLLKPETWREPIVWQVPAVIGYVETPERAALRTQLVEAYASGRKEDFQMLLADYKKDSEKLEGDARIGYTVMLGLIAWKTNRHGTMEKSVDAADELCQWGGEYNQLGDHLLKLYDL